MLDKNCVFNDGITRRDGGCACVKEGLCRDGGVCPFRKSRDKYYLSQNRATLGFACKKEGV